MRSRERGGGILVLLLVPDLRVRAAAPTPAMLPPGAAATATSVVATMAPPPPPATAVAARRRRPRPQSTPGLHHEPRRQTSSNALTSALTSASPSTLTNHHVPNAVTDDQTERTAVAPQRMFLRDAILLAEQNSFVLSDINATNAASAAAAGAGAGHGPDVPMRIDNGLYVRLMGRVVQIHSCDDTADGNDDDDVFSFVIDDGTASVHVVVGHLYRQQQLLQGPSAAKRPRLLQASASMSELDLELGILVDCVGYLSLAAEIDAPVQETADEDEQEERGIGDDGNDEKVGAGAKQPDKQQEQENDDEANAADSTETKQEIIEDANDPIKEQSSCASPTNDDEASAHGKVPQEEQCAVCEDSEEYSDDEQQTQPIYRAVLSAVIIAVISQPDAESLRTLELILAASSTTSSYQGNSSDDYNIGGNTNDAMQGIHMASDLVSKIGAFQHRSQEHQWQSSPDGNSAGDQHQSRAASETAHSICSNTAFRFIRSAAADGGISEEDLTIALGYINGSSSKRSSSSRKSIIRRRSGGNNGRPSEIGDSTEVMAVRHVLQHLQASGEIYKTRRGTYLPL